MSFNVNREYWKINIITTYIIYQRGNITWQDLRCTISATLPQYWYNVGPPSTTLALRPTSTWSTSRVCVNRAYDLGQYRTTTCAMFKDITIATEGVLSCSDHIEPPSNGQALAEHHASTSIVAPWLNQWYRVLESRVTNNQCVHAHEQATHAPDRHFNFSDGHTLIECFMSKC